MADDTTPPTGSMFALGWLMARLFGPFGQQAGPQTWTHLPASSELGPGDSASLAFIELSALLPSGLSGDAVKAA